MSKGTKNALTEVRPAATAIALPEYMQGVADTEMGIDVLKQYVQPPRFKVIQKSSNADLLSQFSEGDLIVMPDLTLFKQMQKEGTQKKDWLGDTFRFTPVFFFAEWVIWNPIQMKGSLPAIRERTLDPRSDIAMRSRTKDLRQAVCPENSNFKLKYSEHLNFMVALHDGPYAGTGIAMTFASGSHKHGVRLCNLIQMRKAPIYGCVFQAQVRWEENQMGDWWSIVAENPALESGPQWVPAEEFETFKSLHLELKEMHEKLLIDYTDDDPNAVDVSVTGKDY